MYDDDKVHTCFSCERKTTSVLTFTEDKELHLAICLGCLGRGIRWIVRQADKEESPLESKA